MVFLGTGTMVVCFKHVGIMDSDRERLKMSVKTLASWSAHAHSTCRGNPSGLVNVDLFKGLTHIGCRDRDHAYFSVICLEASIEVSGRLVSLGSSRLCFPL